MNNSPKKEELAELPPENATENTDGSKRTYEEIIKSHPHKSLAIALFTGITLGLTIYEGILKISKLETIRYDELARYKKLEENAERSVVRSGERVIPKEIPINIIENKSNWINLFIRLYDTEAAFKNKNSDNPDLFLHFGTDAVEHQLSNDTQRFTWSLVSNLNYTISGQGFRVTSPNNFIQPLDYEADVKGNKINFQVPESNKGDRLIAIIRVESKQEWEAENIVSILQSTSK